MHLPGLSFSTVRGRRTKSTGEPMRCEASEARSKTLRVTGCRLSEQSGAPRSEGHPSRGAHCMSSTCLRMRMGTPLFSRRDVGQAPEYRHVCQDGANDHEFLGKGSWQMTSLHKWSGTVTSLTSCWRNGNMPVFVGFWIQKHLNIPSTLLYSDFLL